MSEYTSLVTKNKTFLEFRDFLVESNVIGTSLGFMVASSVLDLSRTGIREILMPLVHSIRHTSIPRFEWDEVAESTVSFLISMFLVFFIIKVFNFQQKSIPMVLAVGAGGMM